MSIIELLITSVTVSLVISNDTSLYDLWLCYNIFYDYQFYNDVIPYVILFVPCNNCCLLFRGIQTLALHPLYQFLGKTLIFCVKAEKASLLMQILFLWKTRLFCNQELLPKSMKITSNTPHHGFQWFLLIPPFLLHLALQPPQTHQALLELPIFRRKLQIRFLLLVLNLDFNQLFQINMFPCKHHHQDRFYTILI